MTHEEFIESIAKSVKKYAKQYGILVYSPIIAQAILESAWGTSKKAKYHNYFGLKYRKNRVSCNNGYFEDGGSEQNSDGTYTQLPTATAWYSFENLDLGVKGYFEFTDIPNYSKLKGVTDPRKYLENIKAAGYATSLKYVDNVYNVIVKNNLTKYDETNKEEIGMANTNSPLVTYKKLTPNHTSLSSRKIDTITIHCIVGQWTAKQGCDYFASTDRQCSSNYVVGKDGSIGLSVEEKNRSWCTGGNKTVNGISGSKNDYNAVTIEVASDTSHPYAVTDKALNALIELCADICKRNGIKQLLWKGDKNLVGKLDKQNMTVHRWFAAKACPGDYLYNLHGSIADKVNQKLGNSSSNPSTPEVTPTPPSSSGINKGDNVKIASGATYFNGKAIPSWVTAKTWIVTDVSGSRVVLGKSTDGQNNINSPVNSKYLTVVGETSPKPFSSYLVKITADVLNVRKGPGTNHPITTTVKEGQVYTIVGESDGWGKLKSGAGYIKLSYTKKV